MKRALLIGSETGGLGGVHADVEVLDDALTRLGFTTIPTIEDAATADGIRGRYRELIEDTRSDDAVVVYYSGHGGRVWTDDVRGWLQFIVPTDAHDLSGDHMRLVLAEELSLLQAELTDRTRNVTVVLDCCHAARMSRDPAMLPKADDRFARLAGPDLVERRRAVSGAAQGADANPDAVHRARRHVRPRRPER